MCLQLRRVAIGDSEEVMGCPIDVGKICILLFHNGMQIPLKQYGSELYVNA